MENRWRGEVAVTVNGTPRVMRLPLGALAELEDALGDAGLVPLIERFETGALRASDLLALIHAGLRGGGWDVDLATVRAATIEGGAIGAARAAAQLLKATFSQEL
ncbi:MAG: gene transfer agent family protein [Pseudomonadota bacterium]